ncbi:MAG: histidinol-phosphatase HisJ family protein [Verrucomicrobia bacterium]|nr:histidinol-phosphatase HisJ family protein [Verrucomicrobiota bacterium]
MSEPEAILPPDYHTHTHLCKHAEGEPADYFREALARGIPEIAATDHCPTPDDFDLPHRMELNDFGTYRGWVEDVQRSENGERQLLGVEADFYPGAERFLSEWLPTHPFDIVLGSVHYVDSWSFPKSSFEGASGIAEIWAKYFHVIGKLADSGLYDVVAHLDLPKRSGDRLPSDQTRECVLPALDRIAHAGMAIELNTSGVRHPAGEFYPSQEILSWASERAIPITFGSDSHQPSHVGSGFAEALEWARGAGYEQAVKFRNRQKTFYPLP